MTRNGIAAAAQEAIVHSITSFALYGFPESHAASFALLAYASAYLKTHYLAAFTAALLNNQPMGFYHPSTVVKDAQRHGLKIRPIDVMKSEWLCTLEPSRQSPVTSRQISCQLPVASGQSESNVIPSEPELAFGSGESRDLVFPVIPSGPAGDRRPATGDFAVRLGLRYIRGLRQEAAEALVRERKAAAEGGCATPFSSISDLARRVPELRKSELVMLAQIGALNSVASRQSTVASRDANGSTAANRSWRLATGDRRLHRRDALWQVERAARAAGPLLETIPEPDEPSPLARMTDDERLVADFRGTGLTVGPHPMAFRRAEMDALGVKRAVELEKLPHGKFVRAAGCVIARQRPGTANGFVFLSLEDETGIANAIITPDVFENNRLLLVSEKFLLIEGRLQHQDNVISVKAERVSPLQITQARTTSHDFH